MSVSVVQLTALIDFLEAHPQLALGRCTRTKEGRSLSKRMWEECAVILNSISADCAQKKAEQWRVYYNEYKSKILKKIKFEKRERSATGGRQAAIVQLTPLQDRLYTILGRDVGDPLPGVRHNPILTEGDGALPGPSSQNDMLEIGLEDEDEEVFQAVEVEYIDVQRQPVPEELENLEYFEETENIQKKKNKINKKERKKEKKTKAKTRQENKENEPEQEPMMQGVLESLNKIEKINSDAVLVHASAVNRLAAAIERIADRLPFTPASPSPAVIRRRRRRSRVVISSDSE